jgi:hypothetical protein
MTCNFFIFLFFLGVAGSVAAGAGEMTCVHALERKTLRIHRYARLLARAPLIEP